MRRISRSFYGGSGESLNHSRGASPSGNQNPRGGSPGGNQNPRGGSPGGNQHPRVGSPGGNQRSGSFVEAFPRRKMAPMANQNHFAATNQKLQKQMEKSNAVPQQVAVSPQSDGEIPSSLATTATGDFDSKTKSEPSSQRNTTVPLTKRLSKINLRKLKIW